MGLFDQFFRSQPRTADARASDVFVEIQAADRMPTPPPVGPSRQTAQIIAIGRLRKDTDILEYLEYDADVYATCEEGYAVSTLVTQVCADDIDDLCRTFRIDRSNAATWHIKPEVAREFDANRVICSLRCVPLEERASIAHRFSQLAKAGFGFFFRING